MFNKSLGDKPPFKSHIGITSMWIRWIKFCSETYFSGLLLLNSPEISDILGKNFAQNVHVVKILT